MIDYGFSSLKELIQEKLKDENIDLYQRLISSITYLGKLSLDSALGSLTNLTRSFIESASMVNNMKLTKVNEPLSFKLVLSTTGRLIIYQAKLVPYIPLEGDKEIGYITLNQGNYDMISLLFQEKEQKDDFFYHSIVKIITQWQKEGQFNSILDQLSDYCTRFETVFLYVNDKHYISSNLPDSTLVCWNNLTSENNLFVELKKKNVQSISKEDKHFIVSFYCLFKSEGVFNPEELNGLNLTPSNLINFLMKRYTQYFKNNTYQDMIVEMQKGLIQFSETVGKKTLKNDFTNQYFRIRYINGLNFNKKEYFIENKLSDNFLNDLPPKLNALAEKVGVNDSDYKVLLHKMLDKFINFERENSMTVAEIDPENSEMNWLEYLIYTLVLDAKNICNFDFSFSSGMKDMRKLFSENESRSVEKITKLTIDEFFCCFNDLDKQMNLDICRGMQGNRWNYLGGNLDRLVNDSKKRYFRNPLLFPDISSFNNFHHMGHVNLGIKHIIRVSGPMLNRAPFKIENIEYRSLFDIRGYKTEDNPFTIEDLNQAMKICSYQDIVWSFMLEKYVKYRQFIPVYLFDIPYYEKRLT